jgi:TolB-like protein
MAREAPLRKLAAIVSIDLVGYSALAERDEEEAALRARSLMDAAACIAAKREGRIFSTAGDGAMLEFASATRALEAVIALFAAVEGVRAGLHVGEVIAQVDGDLLGHGVNVAARLQQAAGPNAVLVSADARRAIRAPLDRRLAARGSLHLRKMNETIEVYGLVSAPLLDARTTVSSTDPDATPVLAVLPFENLSGDPAMQFFSDGLTEEIMQRVARIAQLRVVGRVSSFQFRGRDKAIGKVAFELNVTHIVDGAVRREGDRLRMSVQLIDAQTKLTLWSEQYDRDLSSVLLVQEDIAAEVSNALALSFSPAKEAAPIDVAAYDLYLRGRDRLLNYDRTAGTVRLLEEATMRAPQFAPGWATLARARCERRRFAPDEEVASLGERATHAAQRALELDPGCGLAFAALAALEPPCGRFVQIEALLLKAIAAAPEDIDVHGALSMFYLSVGLTQSALHFSDEAYRRDPLHAKTLNWRSMALVYAGRWPEGRNLAEEACRRWPEAEGPFGDLVFYAALNGEWGLVDSLMTPDRLAMVPQDRALLTLRLSAVDALRRPTDAARSAVMARIRRFITEGRSPPIGMLVFGSILGDTDAVYDAIAECSFRDLRAQSARLPRADVGLHPLFMPYARMLRAHPHFSTLCERLGLTEYWQVTARRPDCLAQLSE